MVQDRCIVSVKVKYEAMCALPNGDISYDLEWPQTTQILDFVVLGECRDFKFDMQVDHEKSQPTENKLSLKWAINGMVTSRDPF